KNGPLRIMPKGTIPVAKKETLPVSLLKRIRQERQFRIVLEHFLAGVANHLHANLPIQFIGYYIFPLFRRQPVAPQLHFGDMIILDAADRGPAVATDILDRHGRQPPDVRDFPSYYDPVGRFSVIPPLSG